MDLGFIQLMFLYFLLSFIADYRKHHNFTPIFILSLLLGWTGIVWNAYLEWSFSYVKKRSASI